MLPHPTLGAHYPTTEAKPAFVNHLFDAGARHYDRVVDWEFLKTGTSYRRSALQRHGLRRGHQLLDVACGTGLVAMAAEKILGDARTITCVDPSTGMLDVAKRKLAARFVLGRAEQLPLPDNFFDFLTMGYAMRHVSTLDEAFREFERVLKPGGKLLILEVTKPSGRFSAFLFKLYFGRGYPYLSQLLTGSRDARKMMAYFWETMDACVPPEAVLEALRAAGLIEVKRSCVLGLFSEYTAIKA